MPLFTNYGKAKDTIVKYMKDIEQRFIPALNKAIDTNINNYPSIERATNATYVDDKKGVKIEFSCNHRDLEEKGDLFITVSYNGMREEAGIINLSDFNDAGNLIYNALHELGYVNEEEKEMIRQRKEREKKQKEQAEQDERDRRQEERIRRFVQGSKETEEKPEKNTEPANEEPEKSEYSKNRELVANEVQHSLDFIGDLRGEGQTITIDWNVVEDFENNSTKISHIIVELTHVAGNNFLLETKRIKPKIQTIVNSDKAKDYIMRVSDKVDAEPVIELRDEKGRPLQLPPEYNGDEVDLGVDL